jgi:hypothetical protein
MEGTGRFDRHPLNVPGDFYVENGCCIACGVPESIAPELIGRTEEEVWHCYWKKQPKTKEEIKQAVDILHSQELGCHRYAGTDSEILKQLPKDCCDLYSTSFVPAIFDPSKSRQIQLALREQEHGWLTRVWRKLFES